MKKKCSVFYRSHDFGWEFRPKWHIPVYWSGWIKNSEICLYIVYPLRIVLALLRMFFVYFCSCPLSIKSVWSAHVQYPYVRLYVYPFVPVSIGTHIRLPECLSAFVVCSRVCLSNFPFSVSPICPYFSLSSVYIFLWPSLCPSVLVSVCVLLFFIQPVCPFVDLSICPFILLLIFLSVYLSICLSVYLSICLSVYLSTCSYFFLSV